MNANYFLFATLESARPIAHGRVPQDANRPPVLTGTPVAGMVYLERPRPAGYFIFPDLSVRHEGKYRLSFNLYEELKDDKDEDRIEEDVDSARAMGQGDAHVTQRLEVKSAPFTVWSAKKFPGLGTSTSLSRCVAEQGCRVRIRRDVRMRRRDHKDSKDWSSYENEPPRTPDAYSQHHHSHEHGRPRSASVGSHVSLAPATASRRSSEEQLSRSYQQAAYPPSTAPQYGYPQLSYSAQPAHHYPTQYSGPAPLPPPPMQSAMPPPQVAPQSYAFAHTQPAPQQYYNYPQPAPQYDGHVQQRHSISEHGQSYATDYRRDSLQSLAHTGYQAAYGSRDTAPYGAHASHHAPSSAMEPPSQAAYKHSAPILPPLNTSISGPEAKLLEPSPTSAGPTSYYSSYSRPSDAAQGVPPPPAPYIPTNDAFRTKRSHDRFSYNPHHYHHESLRNGARPSDEQESNDTYGEYPSESGFTYKDSNGDMRHRAYIYRSY